MLEQMVRQDEAHLLFAAVLVGQRQVVEDRLQQPGAVAEVAVGEEGGRGPGFEPFQQAVAQQRLADAGRAGEQHQAFAVGEALEELGKRLFVAVGRVIAGRVGRRRERPAAQAEACGVHGHDFPLGVRGPHDRIGEIDREGGNLTRKGFGEPRA